MRNLPARGDIYRVDLDPIRGQEQRGKRPVFVLSPAEFNRRGLMIILPLSWFRPKSEMIFVRVNQWVPLPERVARVAAPAVIGRTIGDVGTHGVEFNVPVTGEEIPITLHPVAAGNR